MHFSRMRRGEWVGSRSYSAHLVMGFRFDGKNSKNCCAVSRCIIIPWLTYISPVCDEKNGSGPSFPSVPWDRGGSLYQVLSVGLWHILPAEFDLFFPPSSKWYYCEHVPNMASFRFVCKGVDEWTKNRWRKLRSWATEVRAIKNGKLRTVKFDIALTTIQVVISVGLFIEIRRTPKLGGASRGFDLASLGWSNLGPKKT